MGTDTHSIDDAGAEERPAVQTLLAKANDEHRAVLPARAFDPYLALVLDLDARADAASLLVARGDTGLIGTVTWYAEAAAEGWGGPAGASGLRAMAVDPTRRRQGIGTALVAECVHRSLEAGAGALALHTADWLRDAIWLYEGCGFVRDPAHDRQASELMGVPIDVDFVALAYRLDLDHRRR
jgi:GNAT superfamily N-acetyltransferase